MNDNSVEAPDMDQQVEEAFKLARIVGENAPEVSSVGQLALFTALVWDLFNVSDDEAARVAQRSMHMLGKVRDYLENEGRKFDA